MGKSPRRNETAGNWFWRSDGIDRKGLDKALEDAPSGRRVEVIVGATERRRVEELLLRRGYREDRAEPGSEGRTVAIEAVRTRDGENRPAVLGGPAERPETAGRRTFASVRGALGQGLKRRLVAVAAPVMTAAVGAAKLFSLPRMSFTLFFLAPVVLASYVSGRRTGAGVAVLTAAIQLGISLAAAGTADSFVPYWNAAVRLALLLLAAWLVSEWRNARGVRSS